MHRNVRRLSAATLCALVCSCLVAAVALAATTATSATTKPATKITASTALLSGSINTGGKATSWQFEFTKTTTFITGRGTPVESIPAGQGTVSVTRTAVKLSPNTLYRFRLVAITGSGSGAKRIDGNVLTFVTKNTGTLLLDSTKLTVKGGFVSPSFTCRSTLPCKSKYSIDTRAKLAKTGTFATVVCATTAKKFFTIAPHKSAKVPVKVSKDCTALLKKAAHHRITGQLTAGPRTGQKGVVKTVTLS